MHRIAIIICTWNRASVLGETLACLARMRRPAVAEVDVLVVDNNSSDGTKAKLQALASGWPLGRLHALFEQRQGKQFALNAGIRRARELGCEVLAFTDDDILFPVDWLENIAAVFDADGPALAGGRTELQWPPGGRPGWYHDSMAAVVGGADLGLERIAPTPPDYAPAGANLVARAALFERVGLFSELHFRHMDLEFGQRCQARGEAVTYEPSLCITAPVDPAVLTRRYFRRWAFKAGLSSWWPPGSREFAGVPLWQYLQLLQDALGWLLGPLRREPVAERFARELRLLRCWGRVHSRWRVRWSPATYSAWVERHSQKKQGLY
jgi:glycosyltransferase involved in cell wall biosynthesis